MPLGKDAVPAASFMIQNLEKYELQAYKKT